MIYDSNGSYATDEGVIVTRDDASSSGGFWDGVTPLSVLNLVMQYEQNRINNAAVRAQNMANDIKTESLLTMQREGVGFGAVASPMMNNAQLLWVGLGVVALLGVVFLVRK